MSMTAPAVSGPPVEGRTTRRTSPWPAYLRRRLVSSALLVGVVMVTAFLIVQLVPGDPAHNLVGIQANEAQVEQVREQLGLNEPLLSQFGSYVSGLVHGDLGTSFSTSLPVSTTIGQRLPVTCKLAGLGAALVLLIGLPLGMLMGTLQQRRRAAPARAAFAGVSSVFAAMPEYITGTALIFVFAITLHLLPAQGGGDLESIILPAVAVAFAPTAIFARIVRNETEVVLGQEYVMTARSKRIPTRRLYIGHVLPNVMTSTLTLGGLLLVALLGGTVVTENVFNIAGMGSALVEAIIQSDYPAIQGIILILGLLAISITLAVDVILGLIDPRTLVS